MQVRIVGHLVRFASRAWIYDEMSVGIECTAATLERELLIVLIEESEAGEDEGLVLFQREGGFVTPCLQRHLAELQRGVPFVFEPGIVFEPGVEIGGALLSVFGGVGQAEVFHLLGEAGSIVSPIGAGAYFGIVQQAKVEVELRLQQVVVAAFQHAPIDETLVLCREGAATPFAEVGRGVELASQIVRRIDAIDFERVEYKESSVELGGVFASIVAAQHIAEKRHVAQGGSKFVIAAIGLEETAVHVLFPPVLAGQAILLQIDGTLCCGNRLIPLVERRLLCAESNLEMMMTRNLVCRTVMPSVVGSAVFILGIVFT